MLLKGKGIEKVFGGEKVITNLDLTLHQSETLAVLGQSGCGKTTLLKILAGLEGLDNGKISLNNVDITDISPKDRGIVYLYQEALLFPHLTVFENIAFGLRLRGLPDSEIMSLVTAKIEGLELIDHIQKMPNQLSGGQMQRVNFGRALIVNPKVLLLDEPFGALDSLTRTRMQTLFKKVTKRDKITSIFVTHDLKEALLMGDRFAHMAGGVLKTYSNKESFINDPKVGINEEMIFWKNLNIKNNETTRGK
ncbi:MAG: ABC transporter ATP-binding protein [Sphingomonadales bacterium]